MRRNTYLVVFPGGDHWPISEASDIASAIENGDSIYFTDGNIGFIQTRRSIKALSDDLKRVLGDTEQFFITNVSDSERAGNMVPQFWQFLRQIETEVA